MLLRKIKRRFYRIFNNCNITRKVLDEIVGISPSTIQKHINRLKADNIIIRHGGDRGGYREVIT